MAVANGAIEREPIAPYRAHLHRAMTSYPVDRSGLMVGLLLALVVLILVVVLAPAVWQGQAAGVEWILRVAGFSDSVTMIDAPAAPGVLPISGPSFQLESLTHTALSSALGGFILLACLALALLTFRVRLIPMPLQVMGLFLLVLIAATAAYNVWVSPSPPHVTGRITIGALESGLLISVIASVLFAFQVFPIPGRASTKIVWLLGLIAFSLAFNMVRIAFVLATLATFGSLPFLLLHYLSGVFVDFVYVVLFFSLAVHYLAKEAMSRSAGTP